MNNTLFWILLTSPSAFSAIVSASVVLLGISYGMPIAVNCCRGRRMLPERSFVLPEILGWTLNIVWYLPLQFHWSYYWRKTSQVSLMYIALTTVLFLFPPELPATGSNMSELTFYFPWYENTKLIGCEQITVLRRSVLYSSFPSSSGL